MRAMVIVISAMVFLGPSCQRPAMGTQSIQKPNIVWLVAEDLGPFISSFGDSTVSTPHLERLAREGVRFTNTFSVSGVCSPSRAALCTGMYPSSIGAHHMRTLTQQPATREIGIIDYEVVPPTEVVMVSQIMRENGYYCTNHRKEDHQFRPSPLAWDESSHFAHWRNRAEEQPFFSVFNFNVTHESQIFNPGPLWNYKYSRAEFPPSREEPLVWKQFTDGESRELLVSEDLAVQVPPYLPDNKVVRADIRRMYSNIIQMDRHVGRVLDQLEEDGLLESTIIVWYSDHGGPLPRQKRLLYDSGIRVPMIIRYPDMKGAGTTDERLVSFVDFAPTLLSMAGINPPAHMQGQAFDGEFVASQPRKYVHAAADRFDEKYDMIRAVRDERFKYLRNYREDQGYYLALEYRERMATMQELLRLRDEGRLDEIQMQWFRMQKPGEELFDTWEDPHELNNLADDAEYSAKLGELRQECSSWMGSIEDLGEVPEAELIDRFWPGGVQPVTGLPQLSRQENLLRIVYDTEGAQIGFKYKDDFKPGRGWQIYSPGQSFDKGADSIWIVAHRLGYLTSDTLAVLLVD